MNSLTWVHVKVRDPEAYGFVQNIFCKSVLTFLILDTTIFGFFVKITSSWDLFKNEIFCWDFDFRWPPPYSSFGNDHFHSTFRIWKSSNKLISSQRDGVVGSPKIKISTKDLVFEEISTWTDFYKKSEDFLSRTKKVTALFYVFFYFFCYFWHLRGLYRTNFKNLLYSTRVCKVFFIRVSILVLSRVTSVIIIMLIPSL